MPVILREQKIMDSLDESSKRSLKQLGDIINSNDNDGSLAQEGGPFIQQQLQNQDGFSMFKKPSEFGSMQEFQRQKTPVMENNIFGA